MLGLKRFLLKRRLPFLVIVFCVLAGIYAFVLHNYHFRSEIILFESLASLLLFLVFVFILHRIYHFYHSRSAISFLNLSTILFFSGCYVFIIYQYAGLFFPDEANYLNFVVQGHLLRGILCFLTLLAIINQFWIDKHILDLEKRNQAFLEQEKRLMQIELQNLKQQFQPHFLFNSLNSINALIGSQPTEARKMILLLSDFLRLSIKKKDSETTSLKDELAFLELYLEIEKVRFGDRLNFSVEVQETLIDCQIPTQLLQPLFENAIKYGLYARIGELQISVEIVRKKEFLCIEITNPYDQTTGSETSGTGFGISSVRRKLNLIYKRNDLLDIQKKDDLFTVGIRIPLTDNPN